MIWQKWIIVMILIGSIFFPITQALGQDETIVLGGMQMRFGMPKNEIISYLAKYYKITQLSSMSPPYEKWKSYSVFSPGQGTSIISFDNDKLVSCSKGWGSFHGGEVIKSFTTFFNVLSAVQPTGKGTAKVITYSTVQPGITIKQIEIDYGKKKITIIIAESDAHGLSVSINEELK